MLGKRAFTLVEILVVMFILGILTAIAFPNLMNSQRNSAVVSAQNNLFTIYAAQPSYFFNNNSVYCQTGAGAAICNNLTTINSLLHLSIPTNGALDNNGFAYTCVTDASGFSCSATTNFNGTAITLTVKNIPIAYNGGVGNGTANPTCTSVPVSIYCPVQL